tara:strand:+ start:72 stop:473 length:402 start_codon:yes stop_codon:yes gene_type:complete
MAFKLGSERGNYAVNGEIKSKLSFNKKRGGDASLPGVPVIRKELDEGIMGEANNDGTIFISNEITPGSDKEKEVIMHEMVHMTDMKVGKLDYNDNYIKWDGNVYERKDGMINYEGQMIPEGDKSFPWEKMPWE